MKNFENFDVKELKAKESKLVNGGKDPEDFLPYSYGRTSNSLSYAGQALYNAFAWVINGYKYY